MPSSALFPTGPRGQSKRIQRSNILLDATIRDFSGGWNVVDNDLNLDTKFSVVLENMQRGIDGSNSVRPGTELFAETSTYLDVIINMEYYNGYIVAVGGNGKMVSIDGSGVVRLIWDDERGLTLAGAPGGWSTTIFASFAEFNGELIVCNGVNKPIIINTSMTVTYLHDLFDISNAFVPIARFVVTNNRYLVMAGSLTAGEEDFLFISNTNTSGTWAGASAPNDGITLALGSRVPTGSHIIKGLGTFRDKLLVMFEDAVIPITLGVFSDSDHVPTITEAIENVGCLAHRVIQSVGENILFADNSGISDIRRAQFTGNIESHRAGQFITPEYLSYIHELIAVASQEDRIWSVWDSQSNNFMLFVPDSDVAANTTETRCFVYKRNQKLKIDAWQDWRGWNFRAGCRSALKRVFLCEGTEVFLLGEDHVGGDQIYKDYEGSQEMWDDDTPWTDDTGFNPVADVNDSGVSIPFTWELPWTDNNQRFLLKGSRYINFDTIGDNKFTVQMFTDNIYEDRNDFGEDWEEDTLKFDDGTGWDVQVLDPTLEMEFEGGDAPGFGLDQFSEDFGGGRPTRLEKLYAWTAKYKIAKLRMSGHATKKLAFISITMGYHQGSIRS
jgi:hypothetical protein